METIKTIEALQSLRERFLERGDYDLAGRCKITIEKLIDSLKEV